jgi:hypothetical protein
VDPYSVSDVEVHSRFTDGDEIVSPSRLSVFTPETFLFLISVEPEFPRSIVRLEELGKFENSVTSLGIEPATFRLTA